MIVASNNKGKIKEIKEIFEEFEVKSLSEANIDIDVIEDANTFYGNALKKAKEIYEIAKEPVIADDSGLCIESLNNWPGVLTHRFIDGTDEDRCREIIRRMENIKNRNCSFITNIVYYDGANIYSEEGILNGTISYELKGENGFGFDPIFMLNNNKTLAEVTSEYKNSISARGHALKKIKTKIKNS